MKRVMKKTGVAIIRLTTAAAVFTGYFSGIYYLAFQVLS